jgi:hypothetical protein
MATQGLTLQRQGSQVPVLLIAALVALALAIAVTGIVVNVMDDARPTNVASIQEFDGAGPRGATLDAVRDAQALRNAEAAVSETVASFHPVGRTHQVAEVVLTDTPTTTSYTDCIHCAQRR